MKKWLYITFGKLNNPTQLDWGLITVMLTVIIAMIFTITILIVVS